MPDQNSIRGGAAMSNQELRERFWEELSKVNWNHNQELRERFREEFSKVNWREVFPRMILKEYPTDVLRDVYAIHERLDAGGGGDMFIPESGCLMTVLTIFRGVDRAELDAELKSRGN
jgi:hypothetical protein